MTVWARFAEPEITNNGSNFSCWLFPKLIELHDKTTETINAFGKAKASAQKLVTYLEENPIIEIGKTAQALNMSYNTVSRAVNALIDKGILVCSDKMGKTKIYSYEDYLKILRKDT